MLLWTCMCFWHIALNILNPVDVHTLSTEFSHDHHRTKKKKKGEWIFKQTCTQREREREQATLFLNAGVNFFVQHQITKAAKYENCIGSKENFGKLVTEGRPFAVWRAHLEKTQDHTSQEQFAYQAWPGSSTLERAQLRAPTDDSRPRLVHSANILATES